MKLITQTPITRRHLLIGSGVTAAGILVPSLAQASDSASYPARPISFICPWPAGGTADQSMRAICLVAANVLKQPIVLENKAGAAGGGFFVASMRCPP